MPDGAANVRVGERTLRITNPGKVLFPGSGTTKGELIEYYWRIAPVMLPHLAERPLTRKRWPHGTGPGHEPFFTKNLDSGTPEWVARAAVVHHERTATYPVATEDATVVWCAQMAAIELHVPQWRLPAPVLAGQHPYVLDHASAPPDRLVIDLDPGPGAGLAECCEVALAAREILDGLGLTSVPVTSGSKGLHLYAALQGVPADGASTFAAELADALAAELPRLAITQMKRSLREGKVFVDHTQNNPAKTTLSPYSVRGLAQPFVAAPRAWAEVEAGGLAHLRLAEVLERAADGDPLASLAPPLDQPAPLARGAAQARLAASERAAVRSHAPAAVAAPAVAAPSVPAPMLAVAHDPFHHSDLEPQRWAFEPKWDGYRAVVDAGGDGARLRARSGRDLTPEFPELTHPPAIFSDHRAVLDAEIIALDGAARPSFHQLADRGSPPRPPLRLVLFDVLALDGLDLTARPWHERRAILEALDLPPAEAGGVGPGESGWLTSAMIPGTLADALEVSSAVGGEGVMAKRRDAPYRPGKRSGAWVKIKHQAQARVVVGGIRPGQGRRAGGIGSLLVGIADPDGAASGLRYVGKVGTGFSDAELDRLWGVLAPLRQADSPFTTQVPDGEAALAIWVAPRVVGEVAFDSWTPDGVLRAARWQGQVS